MEFEFEQLHLLALAVSAVFILAADHAGWQYFRGTKATLPLTRITFYHRAVWVGLLGMILTGALLLVEDPDVLEEGAFYVKLLMVAALVVNGVLIGKLSHVAATTPFANLDQHTRAKLLLSGVVSASCWLGAALIGFLV